MLLPGWRGYLIAWFALVWITNVYTSTFNRLRLEIKHENVTIATDQAIQKKWEDEVPKAALPELVPDLVPEHIPQRVPTISAIQR